MSDGETPDEALRHAAEAETAWLAANRKWGKGRAAERPARLVARLPRSIHRDLQQRANEEGVSLNTMMVALLAHGLGKISASRPIPGDR